MSASLNLAATKWARAVRERQAATSALRKAKENSRESSIFGYDRSVEWACSERVTEARKEERYAVKALLAVIGREGNSCDDVIDATEKAKPLTLAGIKGF